MRTRILAALTILLSLSAANAQAKRSAAKASGPVPTGPTAIIDTTAGQMSCKLFDKQAPIGVENFIGLAEGTKEWKSPTSGKSMKGTPLYNGTIFHRVIPEFMIQGGDPSGTGSGQVGFEDNGLFLQRLQRSAVRGQLFTRPRQLGLDGDSVFPQRLLRHVARCKVFARAERKFDVMQELGCDLSLNARVKRRGRPVAWSCRTSAIQFRLSASV